MTFSREENQIHQIKRVKGAIRDELACRLEINITLTFTMAEVYIYIAQNRLSMRAGNSLIRLYMPLRAANHNMSLGLVGRAFPCTRRGL